MIAGALDAKRKKADAEETKRARKLAREEEDRLRKAWAETDVEDRESSVSSAKAIIHPDQALPPTRKTSPQDLVDWSQAPRRPSRWYAGCFN